MDKFDLTPIYEVADKGGLEGFVNYCESLKDIANGTIPDSENWEACDKQRKFNNDFIKRCHGELDKIEEQLLAEYREKSSLIISALGPLEEANKSFQRKILIEKKKDFKRRMREAYFDPYDFCTEDGELVDFDCIWDDDWYGKKVGEVQKLIAGKTKRFLNAPKETFITLTAFMRKGEVDNLKDWLDRNGIKYDITEA